MDCQGESLWEWVRIQGLTLYVSFPERIRFVEYFEDLRTLYLKDLNG